MSTISLITLGVADVARATAFYGVPGFKLSKRVSQPEVSFFQAVPWCWPYGDATRKRKTQGLGRCGPEMAASAQNVGSEHDVDAVMTRAEAAGARILKPAGKTFWGCCNGYFADADGHVWEIAHNPFWQLADGSVRLPD